MEVKDTRSALPTGAAASSHGEADAASPGGAGGAIPTLLGPGTSSTGDPSRPPHCPDDSAMGEGPSSAPESSGSRKRTIEQVNFSPPNFVT
jgi:hypothetical protein